MTPFAFRLRCRPCDRSATRHSPLNVCSKFAVSALLLWVSGLPLSAAEKSEWFEIQVVDAQTGRGIPLIELITVHEVRYVTDNAGRIAFREPGHIGETVFFHIAAQGYTVAADGFGIRGVRLKIDPGAAARVELQRANVAERLYRVTGQDLYRDSVILGHEVPIEFPWGAGQVAGQDSVQAVAYRDKLYWFWGDTNRLAYPLGLFRTAGAISATMTHGGLAPEIGINFSYFTNSDGFVRAMADVPDPQGVVWLDGICTVRDTSGRERLVAHFSRRPGLAEAYEQGLMIFNDERDTFEVAKSLPLEEHWRMLQAHPVECRVDGQDYLMMGNPFPVTRVPATLQDVLNSGSYESWSCMDPTADPATARPRRNAAGQLDYRWQAGPPVTAREELRWLKEGAIQAHELRLLPSDAAAPKERITMHAGTVHWNAYRKRWIMIANEISRRADSPSLLGEVWYSEAESPQGPFSTAVRIVSHDKQSFYNPCHHKFFDQDGGRIIFLEGTYCNTFTQSPPTQRYNYNQIMYRLDLDAPQLRAVFPH